MRELIPAGVILGGLLSAATAGTVAALTDTGDPGDTGVPADTGDTADPDDTGGGDPDDTGGGDDTSTGGDDTAAGDGMSGDDTGPPGSSAAQLAGEEGGCGCASARGWQATLAFLPGLLVLARRRE